MVRKTLKAKHLKLNGEPDKRYGKRNPAAVANRMLKTTFAAPRNWAKASKEFDFRMKARPGIGKTEIVHLDEFGSPNPDVLKSAYAMLNERKPDGEARRYVTKAQLETLTTVALNLASGGHVGYVADLCSVLLALREQEIEP